MTTNPPGNSGNQGTPLWSIPTIPSTVELYDLLMKDIEPELTSRSIATLTTKYRKETREEAAKRAERYAKAFQEYDRRLEKYIGDLNAAIRKFGKEAASSMEALESAMTSVDVDAADSASHS